jgi:hypothetical protein
MFQCHFKCIMIVEYYLTAYPAVYGQFPQAIPQPIAAVPAQREGKKSAESQMKPKIFLANETLFTFSPHWKIEMNFFLLKSMYNCGLSDSVDVHRWLDLPSSW